MLMILDIFSIFRFNFDCTEALFYNIKIYSSGVYVAKKETRKEYFIRFQEEDM